MELWRIDERYVVAESLDEALAAFRMYVWASGRDGEVPPRYSHQREGLVECLANEIQDMAAIQPRRIERIAGPGGDLITNDAALKYRGVIRDELARCIDQAAEDEARRQEREEAGLR